MPPASDAPGRIAWLDTAKGLGMLLVFYGHFVETFARAGVASAQSQQQLVYAFHMPLFFFLSGLLYRRSPLPFGRLVLRRARRLLLPVLVFNVVGMILWLGVEASLDAFAAESPWPDVASGWWRFVTEGTPVWNLVTWFLVAFFFVAVAHDLLGRFTERPLFVGLCALIAGAGLSLWAPMGLAPNPWYLRSAAAGLVLFQIGVLVARGGLLDRLVGWRAVAAAILSLAVLLATFRLNPAPRVMMILGVFGDFPLFLLTGLAGSLLVVALARLLEGARPLTAVGRRTLPLLCLNGLLLALVNIPLGRLLLDLGLGRDGWSVSGACLVYTLVFTALSLPVASALERWLPWSVGRLPRA